MQCDTRIMLPSTLRLPPSCIVRCNEGQMGCGLLRVSFLYGLTLSACGAPPCIVCRKADAPAVAA